jgi:hypothetical protein
MPTLETTERWTYTIDELQPSARRQALQKIGDKLHDEYPTEWVSESLIEELGEKYGFKGMEVYWSLGYCQGDGVAFIGTVPISDLAEKDEFIKQQLDGMEAIFLLRGESYETDIWVEITNSGPYSHWNSMDLTVEYNDFLCHDADLFVATLNRIREHLKEKIKEISRALEAMGYEELEYQRSEECCLDYISEHELRFDVDGELIED